MEPADKAATADLLIVGIGASAGGIEALSRFFDATPANSGCAFVVVLHLDPTRDSQMASILKHHTSMPVVEIADGMRIAPNHVYVIVPDRYLTVRQGRLHLTQPKEPRGSRYPVDVLFSSLAGDQRERAVCIVLSGSGSNGTHGLREVKANGGCALVQDPQTTQFDGMPRSAIAANLADHVLAPEKMPAVLLRYARHAYVAAPGHVEANAPDGRSMLEPILALLHARAGHEFRNYKRNTILRRMHRRMGLTNVTTLGDYANALRTDPAEVKALVKDLMISVTGFFRDPEAWKALGETAIAPLVADRETGATLRIWVPACATGEEAYSVAMLVLERAEAARKSFDLKVFATDSQDDNLSVARGGIYPEAAASRVSPERLRRFFEKIDGSYRIRSELRDQLVFATQNLLRDPPFSRMDLVTCRNLMIYLDPGAQQRVVALSHFALREGGYLFLGNAETLGRHDDLFETVSRKWRIYRRIGPTRHDIVDFPVLGGPVRPQRAEEPARPAAEPPARAADLARRTLLERYAPASVLVDQKGRVLYFHGSTGDYLEQPTGEPTRDLLTMVRDGLHARLRGALREATAKNQGTTFNAGVHQGESIRPVAVTVTPLPASAPDGGLVLVSFEPEPESRAPDRAVRRDGDTAASSERASEEEELKVARTELRSTIEQMEGAHEELKAANEEITSMNEELQSSNEELETSKEELQSYNEELNTINNQLQYKVRQLEDLSNDLSNLLSGTELATVFLDIELRIKWFTPATTELLALKLSDVGRPIGHFAPKFADDALLPDAETVLAKLTPLDAEVRSDAGRWYLRRLLPYRTRDHRIAGVVVTFTDITGRKRANDTIDEARIYSEAIVETVRQPLLVLDADLRVRSANDAFRALFQVSRQETENRLVFDLGNRQWDIPELRRLLEEILPRDEQFSDFRVEHDFEKLGPRIMLLNGRRLARANGRESLILLAIEDITARHQAEAHRDLLVRELSHRVKNVLATVQAVASQTVRQSASLDAFKAAFEGRLRALARAHDLLVDEGWAGTDIGTLVRQTLEPYRAQNGDRIATDGPALALPPQAGVALVMILHELATNAAKYGALSAPGGRLNVTWRVERGDGQPQVRLRWIEAGGPPVSPPSHRGFGAALIERSTAHELRGKAVLEFRDEGLLCALSFPLPESARIRRGLAGAGAT